MTAMSASVVAKLFNKFIQNFYNFLGSKSIKNKNLKTFLSLDLFHLIMLVFTTETSWSKKLVLPIVF